MEPQDDHFTRDQFNKQLESYLMDESQEFRLPELPESNRSQLDTNPSPLQQGQTNQDETTRAASGGGLLNAQHIGSPSDNNDGPPPGFNNQMSNGLSSSNSASSLKITYIVQAPSALQPVQWSSMAQTSGMVQAVPIGAPSSPNPPPPVPTTTLVSSQYNNPTQPLVSSNTQSAGQNSSPSPASASTHQLQPNNNPPAQPTAPSTNMPPPPPQAPCNNDNNNTLQAPNNTANCVPPPSTNDTQLSQQAQSNNGLDQVAPSPCPPAAHPDGTDNGGSLSAMASRFTAAAQGMGNMRPTQYPSPYAPSGFMTIAMPKPTEVLSSQHCGAYVQGGAQMDATGGNGAQIVPFHPQMAVAAGGGGLESGLLPMYSTSTFQEMAVVAQRNNNNRKKKQRQDGAAPKNPRGRPKGSGSKKRNAPPIWEEVGFDIQELEQHARKPYNVRKAEWQDLKLAGASSAGRPPIIINSMPRGDQNQMGFDGGQVAAWNNNNYPVPMMIMMNNPSSFENNQAGQNGDLQAAGMIPNPSYHQPSSTQFGNAASEAVHPVAPMQAVTDMTYGDHAAAMTADQNPNKFWSFGPNNNPPGAVPFPNQNTNNNNENMVIMHPGSANSEGNPASANHTMLQSGNSAPSGVQVVVQAAPSQNNSCKEFGTEHQSQGTNNNNNTSTANRVAAANNNQYWGGGHPSTYVDFENGCIGSVAVQSGKRRHSSSKGAKRSASATISSGKNNKNPTFNSHEDAAVATQVAAQGYDSSCNGIEINNNNPSLNSDTLLPNPMPSSNNQVDDADQYPISVSDYLNDCEGMQLTDEDYIACALREQIIIQPTAQPIQQQQVTQQTTTHLSSNCHHPMPGAVVEQQGVAQQTGQAAAIVPQPMQTGQAGQQVTTVGVSQANNSSEQQGQQAANNINSNNNQPSIEPPPPQSFQQNPSAQYQPAQDGSSSGHQAYMEHNNTFYDTNNAASVHQGSLSQVPANPNAHQTTRPQNMPRISGPTDFPYQQQQQQANSSVNGPRPYAMLPPAGLQHQAPSGFMINRPPLLQPQFYQFGPGNIRPPPKTTRRRRHNTQTAYYPVIDFSQCAITPTMFNDIVHDGSVDSILGSDLWAGLSQDVYNIMVMADPTLLLDPVRLQQRISQINSGMLPIPNLLNAMRNVQQAAGISAPPAANRMIANSNTMSYAPPNGMQSNPTTQQVPGVAAGAANYNFTDPNARVPQMVMNANNIPYVQNQQQPNIQQGGQMNTNLQPGQPNFGYWQEYPALPSSNQRPEEMQQLVTVNQPSAQENVNYNPPLQQAPNQAYNNTVWNS